MKMNKIVVLLCFTGISFIMLSSIKHELMDIQGNNHFILLHGVSFLLLIFIAYAIFSENRTAAKNPQSESRTSFDAAKSLFMYMPAAVMTLKKDFTIIDVNELVHKVSGFRSDTIRGKKCYDVFGNGDVCRDCLVKKALITGNPEYGTQLKYTKAGKQVYGNQTVIPIKNQYGNIECIYEIVTDTTHEVSLERESLENLIDLVTAMAHLIESRDPLTGTHCSNVQKIAISVGNILGLKDKELNDLSIAAIIHDIGKIGIPESILNKPERLTDFEFSIIQRHPQIGYETIKHIKRLQNVSEAIRDHHEYYNGEGYPNGKKKEEISMIARILTVADVFEALTSDRVYRKAMNEKQAISIMQAGKERQFDPVVVDALLGLLYEEKAQKNS